MFKENISLDIQEVTTKCGVEKVIKIPKEYSYMSQVFNSLPKNSMLCKSVAGVGGTTLAIDNSEDYVIAVGSVELIKNKEDQKEHLIGVYSGVKEEDILNKIKKAKFLKSPIKIMTTYDSLYKVVELLGNDVSDCNLLVDELQVLLKASDEFKPAVVAKLFSQVGLFKSVCFMTATPTPRKYFPQEVSSLDYVRLDWEGSSLMNIKKARIQGDITSKVVAISLDHLDKKNGTPIFFYNSLKGIIPCIKQLVKARGLTHKDIKIICADNEDNRVFLKEQLGEEWIPERPLYKDIDEDGNTYLNPRNKPIQFCTKYAFEGLDFLIEDAHTYVISDVRNKKKLHSRIDISTDLQQIAGRCRNQNPLVKREAVFLWNDEVEGSGLSEEEYEEFVKNELSIAKDMEKAYTIEKLKSMGIDFKSSPYFVEIDGKVVVNEYSIFGMCIAYASLNIGYVSVMVGDTVVNNIEDKLSLFANKSDYEIPQLKIADKNALDKKQNFKEISEQYYDLHSQYDITNDESLLEDMNFLKFIDKEFCEIVETIGIDEIKNTGFHKTKSKAKYKKIVGINSISSSKSKAYKNLKLKSGGFYTYSEIKDKIQECFDKLGLKSKAKATDIKQVFNVKRTTRSGVEGYLIGDKV